MKNCIGDEGHTLRSVDIDIRFSFFCRRKRSQNLPLELHGLAPLQSLLSILQQQPILQVDQLPNRKFSLLEILKATNIRICS